MSEKPKKGDWVRVRRCRGLAQVLRVSRVDQVVFLDHKMSVKFPGGEDGVDAFVPYWTFPAEDLTVVEGVQDE